MYYILGVPRYHELDRLDWHGKSIRIISSAAARWEKIATRLYFDGNEISAIRRDCHFQVEDACRSVLIRWLEGNGRKPTTWDTLIRALVEADLGTLAGELQSILCKIHVYCMQFTIISSHFNL